MICDSSPVQVTPSPAYPVLHRQLKLPGVLVQFATVAAQLLVPAVHSSMSANIKSWSWTEHHYHWTQRDTCKNFDSKWYFDFYCIPRGCMKPFGWRHPITCAKWILLLSCLSRHSPWWNSAVFWLKIRCRFQSFTTVEQRIKFMSEILETLFAIFNYMKIQTYLEQGCQTLYSKIWCFAA